MSQGVVPLLASPVGEAGAASQTHVDVPELEPLLEEPLLEPVPPSLSPPSRLLGPELAGVYDQQAMAARGNRPASPILFIAS
jgi:hypothetical protein